MTDYAQNISLFVDLIDIALAAFVIYRISILLKGTLAVRIQLTVAALLLGHLICRLTGLETLRLLFDCMLGSSVVIIAIIFQTDIRRAAATLSRTRPGEELEKEAVLVLIEELAIASEGLAQKRIGALIVVERGMTIDNYLVIGTDIDAKVTSELISSIFLPYSPIHDGAVIIQKGKLTKAGCFLPLTQDPEISRMLGTRHRAAIGLTELVDAVAIVVSEESGGISIVVGGKRTGDVDGETLRKTLRRLIEPRWLS
jgi:uncharacterized protein (TIGR00159 family)